MADVEEIFQDFAPGYPDGDPATIRSGATAWRAVARDLRGAIDQLDNTQRVVAANWRGADYEAFRHEYSGLATDVREFAGKIDEFAGQLDSLASGLQDAQAEYKAASAEVAFTVAIGIGLTVITGGLASAPAGAAVAAQLASATSRVAVILARVLSVMRTLSLALSGFKGLFVIGFASNTLAQGVANEIVYPDRGFFDKLSFQDALVSGISFGTLGTTASVVSKLNMGNAALNATVRGSAMAATSAGLDGGLQVVQTGHIDFGRVLFSGGVGFLGGASIPTASASRLTVVRITNEQNGSIAEFTLNGTGRTLIARIDDIKPVDLTVAAPRNAALARSVRLLGLEGDDAGHLLARLLGGPEVAPNYVPQNFSINRGAYRNFEKMLADLASSGSKVSLEIRPAWGSSPVRPTGLNVKYSIDGQHFSKFFPNMVTQ